MRRSGWAILLLVIGVRVFAASAQDMTDVPSVTVSDQVILDNTVIVDSVYNTGPGFVVIHIDNGGAPGPVAGVAAISPGWNYNVIVQVDPAMVTPLLFAMLHTDDGAVGTYEFDGQSGLDNPVAVDGAVVTPGFNAALLNASDQLIENNSVTITNVAMSSPGWVVIHSDNNGAPGPVLGQSPVEAGQSAGVTVQLAAEMPVDVVWPMLHVDDGTAGSYEFDGQSGLDNPVTFGGRVATTPIFTTPHVRVNDQIVIGGDGQMRIMVVPTVIVQSVLSDGPGWMVIHTDNNGQPGPIAGVAPVAAGSNTNVEVVLDQNAPTSRLFAMLHTDDGAVGTYEFDGQSGLDNPVTDTNGEVIAPVFNGAPNMLFDLQTDPGAIVLPRVLIDAPGWLVIHSDSNGGPGPVLGYAPLRPGMNVNVRVQVDSDQAGAQVFPMLHYDTGEIGVYEFGTVDGADLPVSVGGEVVVGPLATAAQ